MFVNILLLLGGLALILCGANILTDGSASVARRFGISSLVVGLTVVAFGTSSPELAISMLAAIQGNAGIAVGNVVGSNIFNILAIIGVTALVRPIPVAKTIMTTQIPIAILAALLILVIGSATILDGAAANVVTRVDGIILLLFFLLFMRETLMHAKSEPQQAESAQVEMPVWRAVVFIIGGLAGLIVGGNLFVRGASAIASGMGVSDAIIGLTIVAIGTSLPEMAASVVAALKGNPDLALGNVIGSNVFNIFLILGASSVTRPLPFEGVGVVDLLVLMAASLIFWLSGWFIGHRKITRGEGAGMVILYALYMTWLVVNA